LKAYAEESAGMLPFPLTVLYVEDDPEARELTRFFLEGYFTKVLAVESGEEALDTFLREQGIDVVITDLSLPGFDGFEMLRRMRKRQEDLAIVIFSAYAETSQMLQAIDLAVDGYLLKPFDPERFEEVVFSGVSRLLRRRDQRRYRGELEERLHRLEAECERLRSDLAAKEK
jgi:CheY-like chemotaxis protein